MSENEFYKTIRGPAYAELKDRGSKFLAYAFPIQSVDNFKIKLQELKKEHPKAAHHCFAYRLGIDRNNFRMSDDGEPPGTAGRPILGQIDSKGLTNVLLIIVRYFGGTLLGVPGLISAYKTAATLALQETTVVQKPVSVRWQLNFDYTQMNEVMRRIKAFNCEITEQDMQLFCRMVIDVPKNRMQEMTEIFRNIYGLKINFIGHE